MGTNQLQQNQTQGVESKDIPAKFWIPLLLVLTVGAVALFISINHPVQPKEIVYTNTSDNSQSSPSEDVVQGSNNNETQTDGSFPRNTDILGQLNFDWSNVNGAPQSTWEVDAYSGVLPQGITGVYLSTVSGGDAGCSVWVAENLETLQNLIDEGVFDFNNEYWRWGEPGATSLGALLMYTDDSLDCYKDAMDTFIWSE